MTKKRLVVEFGMGTSLRKEDYTGAACRALRNALWQNSLTVAPALGFDKSAMLVDVEVAVQEPDAVDTNELAKILPYGQLSFQVAKGGLDIPKPDGMGKTVIANVAVVVSIEMEPAS